MKEDKSVEKNIKYDVFSIRLHEETKKKLIKKQKQSGLSWNLFILKLTEK
jgi:hypothetical protein